MGRPSASELDALLDDLSILAGQEREITPLPGGLTNHNYRVRTVGPGRPVDAVVRISPATTALLAVDRVAEHANSIRAAAVGVGAPVLDYLPGRGVLVVGFLPGRTYDDADVAANLPRVAAAVRQLHTAEPFASRFDMFEIQRRYAAIAAERHVTLPAGYAGLAPHAARLESVFAAHPQRLVPCNNDLLAANFLDDGDRISIIDYEYSGNNEAMFELGNIAAEAHLDGDQLDELVTAYLGRVDPSAVARAELWGQMGRYGWTLWGLIQGSVSDIDFDFTEWAMDKYEPAAAFFTSARFERLLAQVDS